MTRGSRVYDFSYDANGTPVSMAYRSTAASSPIYYYYGLNSRGDVIALYYNTGAIAARYSYDAYGKLLGVTTSSGSQFTAKYAPAVLNPLRYRGYVYDTETELYYLQSRYYDPTTCRFINADGYCATGQGITGNNAFVYCGNNPVLYLDSSGTRYCAGANPDEESYSDIEWACQWNLLSSVFHRKNPPTKLENLSERVMSDFEIQTAVRNVKIRLPDFDFDTEMIKVNDISVLKELYRKCNSNYEKLQIFRIIFDRAHINDVVKQYINETFHIENDYLFQLDPSKYDTVPSYIIDICDSMVADYTVKTIVTENL